MILILMKNLLNKKRLKLKKFLKKIKYIDKLFIQNKSSNGVAYFYLL
jgi:hypothetical protein